MPQLDYTKINYTLGCRNRKGIFIPLVSRKRNKQIIITKAEKGATVYLKESNSITKIQKNALLVKVSNKVGCGDVFGAVYFYNYIKYKNVLLALEQANLFAGITATFSDADDFLNLKKNANKWIS
jgi:sugar/nucleoside kinase (ribokinase family)